MANINGKTIPGGIDWSGITNALYNTLQAPYDYRQNQIQTLPGGDNYIDPNDVGGTPMDAATLAGVDPSSFAGDNEAVNGPGYYANSPAPQVSPVPYAQGSLSSLKDQSQIAPSDGQAFAYSSPPQSAPSISGALNGFGSGLARGLAALPSASVIRNIAGGDSPDPLKQWISNSQTALAAPQQTGGLQMIRPQMAAAQPRATGLAAIQPAAPAAPAPSPAPWVSSAPKVAAYQALGLSPSQAYAAASHQPVKTINSGNFASAGNNNASARAQMTSGGSLSTPV